MRISTRKLMYVYIFRKDEKGLIKVEFSKPKCGINWNGNNLEKFFCVITWNRNKDKGEFL